MEGRDICISIRAISSIRLPLGYADQQYLLLRRNGNAPEGIANFRCHLLKNACDCLSSLIHGESGCEGDLTECLNVAVESQSFDLGIKVLKFSGNDDPE